MEAPIPEYIARADFAMRHWTGSERGTVRPGSEAHKRLFCHMLLETHNPYKPAVIEWPDIASDALQRLTSLPIWDIAVQTEGRAAIRVRAFANGVRDPLLRSALEMDAAEEARHKEVLSHLVGAYGIELAPEPEYTEPRDPEWAWLATGYAECLDTFFAFGLFELARRSGFFPPELVETFEPVIQEEARHIIFFINWAAWHRRNLSWWRRALFTVKVMAVSARLVWERIGIARGVGASDQARGARFVMTGGDAVGINLTTAEFIELCLTENARRLQGYDGRLMRPTTVPKLADLARRLWGKHALLGRRSDRQAPPSPDSRTGGDSTPSRP